MTDLGEARERRRPRDSAPAPSRASSTRAPRRSSDIGTERGPGEPQRGGVRARRRAAGRSGGPGPRAGDRRLEVRELDADAHRARLEGRAMRPVQLRDPARPAAGRGSAPSPTRHRRSTRGSRAGPSGLSPAGQPREPVLRALQHGIDRRRRDCPRSRARVRLELRAQLVDDPLRLVPRDADGSSRPPGRRRSSSAARRASPARSSASRARSSASLGLALGRLDRRQRRLERLLRLGQARPGVGDERLRQAEPLGDRERLGAARAARSSAGRSASASRGRTRPRRSSPGVVWAYAFSSA